MLDDMPLADKLQAAREWFRLAQEGDGDMPPFDARSAQRFCDLLKQCEHEAALLDAHLQIERASLALVEGRRALDRAEDRTDEHSRSDVPFAKASH